MRAIEMREFGTPDVLRLVERDEPADRRGFVRIAVEAAGVNYADTLLREDAYLHSPELPLIPGTEVVGRRGDTGERVLAICNDGGYADVALAHESMVFPLPDGLDGGAALALLIQGLTAWHALQTCARVRPGDTVAVHAAAGGVGSLAIQLAVHLGAERVVATASTEEKRALATELGAHEAIDSAPDGLADRMIAANNGRRFDVVLEMAGGRAFAESLTTVAPLGRLVAYGRASGEPALLDVTDLIASSRAVIGFWLAHCLREPELVRTPLEELMGLTVAGELRPVVVDRYPLADAAAAHAALRGRTTVGKVVLDVS